MTTPEQQLQGLVLNWLSAEGIFAIRFNTGAVKQGNRFIRFGTAGCADVLACPVDKPPVWIELKATTKQSPAQRSFQLAVESAGHVYKLARSLEEVQEVLS